MYYRKGRVHHVQLYNEEGSRCSPCSIETSLQTWSAVAYLCTLYRACLSENANSFIKGPFILSSTPPGKQLFLGPTALNANLKCNNCLTTLPGFICRTLFSVSPWVPDIPRLHLTLSMPSVPSTVSECLSKPSVCQINAQVGALKVQAWLHL